MKKTNKIIIIGSMLCMVLSIVGICFSFAWYALYPSYSNIIFGVGEYSLTIRNQVFLRTRDAQGADAWGTTKGVDYNIKTEVKDGAKNIPNINDTNHPELTPDKQTGRVIITFPSLTFNFFEGKTNATGSTAPNTIEIPKDALLDEETMSWNVEYLTFAMFEFAFFNTYFSSFTSADFKLGLESDDQEIRARKDTLFNLKRYQDDTVTADSVTPSKPYSGNELRGHRLSLIGLGDSVNTFNQDVRDELVSYGSGPETKDFISIPTKTIEQALDVNVAGLDLFADLNSAASAGPETPPHTIEIKPNPNKVVGDPQKDYYARAMGLSLSIDPYTLFDYFKASNASSTTIKLVLVADFASSNMAS